MIVLIIKGLIGKVQVRQRYNKFEKGEGSIIEFCRDGEGSHHL